MKNKKSTFLLLISVGIIIAGVLFYFFVVPMLNGKPNSGNNAAGAVNPMGSENSENALEKAPAKKRINSYPVGQWSLPIPEINPFGSQENYLYAEHLDNAMISLAYVDDEGMEAHRMFGGSVWQLKVEWLEESMSAFEDLEIYMHDIGGQAYLSPRGESCRILAWQDKEGNKWWGMADSTTEGYDLTVYKELVLKPGEKLTFKTSDYPDERFYFTTMHPGDKFQSMIVTLSGGQIILNGKSDYLNGGYSRAIDYSTGIFAYKTPRYVLDNLPQDASGPVQWEVEWTSEDDPVEVAFEITEQYELSPITYGERIGALKVRGVNYGECTVEMEPSTTMVHPDFSELNLRGDVTPEGDTLFYLPAGYWNLKITPTQNQEVSYGKTLLIPVNSGEMTTLNIPSERGNEFVSREGTPGEEQNGITILETKEEGAKAQIVFELLDADEAITPGMGNTSILEGGQPGRLLSLERLPVPPSVVLVLDSSGSMKGQMEQTLAAAKTFIEGLPDNSHIQVIDFDTAPRLIKGSTKAEVIKGLQGIKANGATALYDSILEGLKLLEGKERPTLVVFTDGVDANTNDTGPGSTATKQEVIDAIGATDITLFAIGFGPKHDNTTLLQLAGVSDGKYYPATDKNALDQVFATINNKLGNTYRAVYERPAEVSPSDQPYITVMMDNSGSMDMNPEEAGCGYRIDRVKNLYHDFLGRLPEGAQVQLMGFSDGVDTKQIFTSKVPELLSGLSTMIADSGTEILLSTDAALKSLKAIPSNKRVLVYQTDAALDVGESNRPIFEKLLLEIKEEGIQVLWVGLGVEDSEEAFQWAAEKSGGAYVISEDPAVLGKAFDDLLARVQKMPSNKLSLKLTVKGGDSGSSEGAAAHQDLSASKMVDFPIQKASDKKINLDAMDYQTGTPIKLFDKTVADTIGSGIPGEESKVFLRVPVNASGKNKQMEASLSEAFFLTMLRGVEAPYGKCYLALNLELKNTSNIPYVIPDIASHFYLTYNKEGSYPASPATWLAEKPLAAPGEYGIFLAAGQSHSGTLLFLVPDERMAQASLHFYDTINGHLTLAVAGKPQMEELAIEKLPAQVEGKLSDTFAMKISGVTDQSVINELTLQEDSVFRILDGSLTSKVQAILDINPQERFFLRMDTKSGTLMTPMSPATAYLPYGFLRPVMMAPGSANAIRMAYQIPASMKTVDMDLYGDINGGALVLPVKDKTVAGRVPSGTSYPGDGVSLTVNALTRLDNVEGYGSSMVIADITLNDVMDGEGTTGFADAFTLVRDDYDPLSAQPQEAQVEQTGLGNFAAGGENPSVLEKDPVTGELLFGISDQWQVFDGQSRRGFIVFALPGDEEEWGWHLESIHFSTLKHPLANSAYADGSLLVKTVAAEFDETFTTALEAALIKVIEEYQTKLAASGSSGANRLGLEASGTQKNVVPVPPLAAYGATMLDGIRTWDSFISAMTSLRWLPSKDDNSTKFYYRNAPEAVLTQGWGSENDMAAIGGKVLARLGYNPVLKFVRLTEQGRKALLELGQLDEQALECLDRDYEGLPAHMYYDDTDQRHILVYPFMKDLSELKGLVYMPGQGKLEALDSPRATLYVSYLVTPRDDSAQSQIGNAGDVLGGGGEEGSDQEEIRVLEEEFYMDQLSLDAVDVRPVATVDGKGVTAALDVGGKTIIGSSFVNLLGYQVVGVLLTVYTPDGEYVHETPLGEGEPLGGLFYTLSVNAPELPEKAAQLLEKSANTLYDNASNPDSFSALRWYNRSIISRFIANQTSFENKLAEDLKVTVGRNGNARCMIVSVKRSDADAAIETSIDLLQVSDPVHKGTDEAVHAFNIASGIFASRLEGAVLGSKGLDFNTIWDARPKESVMMILDPAEAAFNSENMRYVGYPEKLVAAVEKAEKVILVPNLPSIIDGEERWAWLEINPETYETLSVLDNGLHGGVEFITQEELLEESTKHMMGAMLGVEMAVWAVVDFSLVLSDYEDILQNAEALCGELGEVMEDFLDFMGDVKDLASGNGLSSKVETGIPGTETSLTGDGLEIKLGGGILGFKDGYDAGVAFYFKAARAH